MYISSQRDVLCELVDRLVFANVLPSNGDARGSHVKQIREADNFVSLIHRLNLMDPEYSISYS